jgi:hypothetical protein
MAYNNDQQEYPLPDGSDDRRRSSQHLPRYFRTEVNNKFLSSTMDQMIQPGVVENLNGYIGRKEAKAFKSDDFYLGDISKQRDDYQLEPASIIQDNLGNITFYKDYNDYRNQLKNLENSNLNDSIINQQEYYAWNPHVDWDKLVNFREYYWLPNGPDPIPITGNRTNIATTYTVNNVDNLDNRGFVFSPDGLTQNPELTLYRGITYRFEIDSPNLPISIRTNRIVAPNWRPGTYYLEGESVQFNGQIFTAEVPHRAVSPLSDLTNSTIDELFELDREKWNLDNSFNLVKEISKQNVENGTIELTLGPETPDFLYYLSNEDINAGGLIRVYDIDQASFLNIEQEILGKKTYTTTNGFSLSNGMKVYFQGSTFPEKFQEGNYYVEGVGEFISLITEENLTLTTAFVEDEFVEFDSEGFDTTPFSRSIGFPREKDYLTINRSSQDGNLWSKYNRWFHREIIETAARINQTGLELDQNQRAIRPIIEFEPNIRLFNFGTIAKQPVDLVDNFTTDVFSTVEGSQGYNIDGVNLQNGMRVLFTADTDQRVRSKIYRVNFINFQNNRQIALTETDDSEPLTNEVVLCGQGTTFGGRNLFFNGVEWKLAQEKRSVNQAPLFEVYNCSGDSLADPEIYEATIFNGTEIFSYRVNNNGIVDSELGFPLSYRNIENVGDIVFEFDLLKDAATYCPEGSQVLQEPAGLGVLHQYKNRTEFDAVNGWKIADNFSDQRVIRQFVAVQDDVFFPIDMYDESGLLTDLELNITVNNKFQIQGSDYQIVNNTRNTAFVQFFNGLNENDIVLIKAKSKAPKNNNGLYEIPSNLEKNPLNENLGDLTLGEINDHARSIVEEIENFSGEFPGISNLRDQQNISKFGKRIIKHSAPLNLALFHLVDKDANLVKALRFAKNEYAKFKRNFLQVAFDLGFNGDVKKHVDLILKEVNRYKNNSDPFYFSDMLAYRGEKVAQFEIESDQQKFFSLIEPFSLNEVNDKAVYVYLNRKQLLFAVDYTFNSEGFLVLDCEIKRGDVLEICEYESTNGSFIPPTPTKLGLYPLSTPEKLIDDTYLETQEIIQGHDGSKILAFGDFRDDLLLELEYRIFNNIKVTYDKELFNINEFVPSIFSNTSLTQEQIENTMLNEFVEWTELIDEEYSENRFYNRQNPFTYNYTGSSNYLNQPVSGYWRAIYKNAFDTDRPHSHPWEMLGFTSKPAWWEDQYGPAPYTKDNLILWEDLEEGIIRESGNVPIAIDRYKRPGLTSALPVDNEGNLVAPLTSGYIQDYNPNNFSKIFKFGDQGPVETAWRRSSEYPFALLLSLFINQPNRIMAVCFDRIRQQRSIAGEIIYNEPNQHIQLSKLVFPNSINDNEKIFSSGLVNYMRDYLSSSVSANYNEYKNKLRSINNEIGFKLGGFTSKDKFNVILDSRTPTNQGNVFIPEENYKIFLNQSSPVENIFYSGVIIEKQPEGFVIKGYNKQRPFFIFNRPLDSRSNPSVNVGGISEVPTQWEQNIFVTRGIAIQFEGSFYRVSVSHNTGTVFDETKFVKIPKLPITGGRDAIFKRKFNTQETRVPYGTLLPTIQDVVDFLLGYQNYLESKGFIFDYYNNDTGFVANWETSAKEFMFWTTQNWSAGTVLALSPVAERLKFRSEFSVVDDIYDTFYGYSLLKVDGNKFSPEFVSLTREEPNFFEIRPKATADGIFAVRLSLVQKEHVFVIDNKTSFNDIIYDQIPGYRQERVKVLGYRTANWDGSFNTPGFIFDNAVVTEWQPWKDYAIGDTVKYKELYYAAKNRIPGSPVFNSEEWTLLTERPTPQLLPNWEYKTNQFADFYDLDSDNFDEEQQKFAQHLIGYQNRDYLANIINDDVSQYKFYQGFIQDKGTSNALLKLFDVLGNANKESLEFYEEWAIKAGQYGASQGFKEVQYKLDETQFNASPQPIELTNSQIAKNDLVYRIPSYEVFLKNEGYDHKPFPEKKIENYFLKTSGYVNPEDINFKVDQYADILNINFQDLNFSDIVWIGNENNTWNIYTVVRTDITIELIETGTNGYRLYLDTTNFNFEIGEIIGVYNQSSIEGLYQIDDIKNNYLLISVENPIDLPGEKFNGKIYKFVSTRFENEASINAQTKNIENGIQTVWVDNIDNDWKVLQRNKVFSQNGIISQEESELGTNFATSFDVNDRNTVLVVGEPDRQDGQVCVYTRPSPTSTFSLVETLELPNNIADSFPRFGASVAISQNGDYLAIGSPNASNVKTAFRDDFIESNDYAAGEIVRYQDNLWQALTDINGSISNVIFGSFASVLQSRIDLNLIDEDEKEIPILLTANYPFQNIEVANQSHILVRAPVDMYDGSAIGDKVVLKWNTLSYAYQNNNELTPVEPFNNEIQGLDSELITREHTIAEKVDIILHIQNATTVPTVGQTVNSLNAFGTVSYAYNEGSEVTLYIADQNGNFGLVGSLITELGEFVGEYNTAAPINEIRDIENYWGGFWKIDLDFSYTIEDKTRDEGLGLVYTNLITEFSQQDTDSDYYNILDYSTNISSSLDTRYSEIISLPNNESNLDEEDLYLIRAPKEVSDELSSGDQITLFYNNIPSFDSQNFIDTNNIGLSPEELNRTHNVLDLWDGYIVINATEVINDVPVIPKVGLIVQDVTNGGTAEIVLVENVRNIRWILYVKEVQGRWALGSEFGEPRQIEFLSDGSGDSIYDPALGQQLLGIILSRSLGLPEEGIGKLLVFDKKDQIPFSNEEAGSILDAEYWFYTEKEVAGRARPAEFPSEASNNWQQVFNIPAGAGGTSSGLQNEGLFSIYKRTGTSQWSIIDHFIVPQRHNNSKLGYDLEFAEINDIIKLFVRAKGENVFDSSETDYGRLFVIKNGIENGYNYNWEIGRDKQYKGEFTNTRKYFENDIVFVEGQLYQAKTNIDPESFDFNDWELLDRARDYLGFLPNDTSLVFESDIDNIIDLENLQEFAFEFSVSKNGEVLVIALQYNNEPNRVVIYRNLNGLYIKTQEIFAETSEQNFGATLDINEEGNMLAIGSPTEDIETMNDGAVFIYKQINKDFEIDQIVFSPIQDKNEQFGYEVSLSNDIVAITSKNGDSQIDTTFDSGETSFDNSFTKFVDFNKNTGVVHLYEKVGNKFVYGETVDFEDSSVRYFGRNIKIKNNQLYVGLPDLQYSGLKEGILINFYKKPGASLWNVLRESKSTVDVNKIKKIFLYNTVTNKLINYLDYIDPLQGKIAGIAEQEIDFKLYYDPAVYTVGSNVNIDKTNFWGEDQVGKIWWDLTKAKFIYPYQNSTTFSANNWNNIFSDFNEIEVYEWVESDIPPSRWDELSGTASGISQSISGNTKYGDNAFVQKRTYDRTSKTFGEKFYYWVKNKITVPNTENRNLSAQDISKLIQDPAGQGYRFVSLISPTEFALYNCNSLIQNDDIAVSFQVYTIDDQRINVHDQYQIITEGLETSRPKKDIEQKWFDSLIGYDEQRRLVPALELSEKEKYGILNRPRQSWFINRVEALKQAIDRVNRVLENTLLVNDKDLSNLEQEQEPPSFVTNLYDVEVESKLDLQFIGTARLRQAKLNPIFENGQLIDVQILDSGRGYIVPPTVEIRGTGSGAEVKLSINNQGEVVNTEIVERGRNYNQNSLLNVRRFSVLVRNDETLGGRWSLYERDYVASSWFRTNSQGYNVKRYWEYKDWYAAGVNQFTNIDWTVSEIYELSNIDDEIRDIIKVDNIGSGGWILLQKIDNQPNADFTVNYSTIGQQNGTIQFKSSLYDIEENLAGFDVTAFDNLNFDSLPSIETRIILKTIRDNIFIDELSIEYNKLFFSSLRYVFSEQNYVDWAFKTSFIKARHNVGELEQRITFRNDNLQNFEDYFNEVKPYKSNVREYLSAYDKLDNSRTLNTDFDLSPIYSNFENRIRPIDVKVSNNSIAVTDPAINLYPNKNWLDNVGFSLEKIEIADPGFGYTTRPIVFISGGGGTGAEATASLGRNGIIKSITVTNPGQGYISTPEISINGSLADGGRPAAASAYLGNSLIRTIKSTVKFDRVSGDFYYTDLETSENFIGSGNRRLFELEWPLDTRKNQISVFVNNQLVLTGSYTFSNQLDKTKGYDRYKGQIFFDEPPARNSEVRIIYNKNISLLDAQDRINFFYNLGNTEFDKPLGQLIDGVDYGGVEVTSFDFDQVTGWDTQPWASAPWDIFDNTFEDEIFYKKVVVLELENSVTLQQNTIISQDSTGATGRVISTVENSTEVKLSCNIGEIFNTIDEIRFDDSTVADSSISVPINVTTEPFELAKPLEDGVEYNLYKITRNKVGSVLRNIRLDDPNYDGSTILDNDAIIEPIIGDGERTTLDADEIGIDLSLNEDETSASIILRKSTSDGSISLDEDSYDTDLSGGDLSYSSATGILAEDINFDGDGFVTTTTSKGPEEVVPGQIIDTLDITVYENPIEGSSNIVSRNYIGNGVKTNFDIGTYPISQKNVFVKLDNIIQTQDNYTINYTNKEIVFTTPPATNSRINIIVLQESSTEILEVKQFKTNKLTSNFELDQKYKTELDAFVTVNGIEESFTISNESLEKTIITTATPVNSNRIVTVILTNKGESIRNYSIVEVNEFEADGSTIDFTLDNNIFVQQPAQAFSLVKVNNTILSPGYSQRFFVNNENRYQLDLTQVPVGSVNGYEIEVYLNGRLLEQSLEWNFEGAGGFDSSIDDSQPGSVLFLKPGTAEIGDELKVHIISGGEYRFGFFDQDNRFNPQRGEDSTLPVLHLDQAFQPGDNITVYTFSNHNSQGIERQVLEVLEKTQTKINTPEYFEFQRLTKGKIKLRKQAFSVDWVWLIQNGTLLSPSVDYNLTIDKKYIQMIEPPKEGDVLDIIHFSANPTNPSFGWRQFKDMLNRVHYKKLSSSFTLATDLHYYDKVIVVENADSLPDPRKNSRQPGVIFLDKERIEYFIKDGNELKQLRRGTLGTGVKQVYSAGTQFVEQGNVHNIPYKDDTQTVQFVGDGTSNTFELPFEVPSVDYIEVFVAGKRLCKFEQSIFDKNLAQDSPEGDILQDSEFEIEFNTLKLTKAPEDNVSITVIRKSLDLWTDFNTPLALSNTEVAKFLRRT